jgi:hypothetical protein
MSNRNDDPPANAFPFGQGPQAITDELRRYYKTLVEQQLPDKISALYERFDQLTKEKPEPEAHSPQDPAAEKKPPE